MIGFCTGKHGEAGKEDDLREQRGEGHGGSTDAWLELKQKSHPQYSTHRVPAV